MDLNSTDVQSAIDELYKNCSVMTSSSKYLYFAVNEEGSIVAKLVVVHCIELI